MHFQKKGPALGIDRGLVFNISERLANQGNSSQPSRLSMDSRYPIQLVLLFQDGLLSLLVIALHKCPLLGVGAARTISRPWQNHLVRRDNRKTHWIRAPAAAFATSSRPPGR